MTMTQATQSRADPERGRLRTRWPGAAWAVGGVASAGLLLARDPNVPGAYGFCPLQAVTGLDCPLCGGLRGTHALLHGDVGAALDFNVLLPVFLVAGGALAVGAARRRPLAASRGARLMWVTVVVAAVVFGVLRNLPWFPWLSSTA